MLILHTVPNPIASLHILLFISLLHHFMAIGICSVCHESQAKYKCPKCSIDYCSLACFKSPNHQHLDVVTTDGTGANTNTTNTTTTTNITTSTATITNNTTSGVISASSASSTLPQTLFPLIVEDPVIKSLLGYKSLQVHLAVILRLLSESSLTNEPLAENRREIANLRLCDLRTNGSEENALVEEFIQRVLYLTHSNENLST